MKATIDTKPFLKLATTEEFFLFPEDNEGTIPLDPTNQQHLRSMSPFVLTIDPPNMGDYLTTKKKANLFQGQKRLSMVLRQTAIMTI